MKVKVRRGDLVTYKEVDRRTYQGHKVIGALMSLHGSVYSVHWLTPKQYKGGYSWVGEDFLVVLLKKNDARWQ